MRRAIVGFHCDEAGDPVADLDCGHGQHVRHRPPFINRPWVATEAGRANMLGTELACLRCDRMEWPDGLVAGRRTPDFYEHTVPAGLTREHATKRGVWARIHVVAGKLAYTVAAPVNRAFLLDATTAGVVVPQVVHRVSPQGRVRFYVRFFKVCVRRQG